MAKILTELSRVLKRFMATIDAVHETNPSHPLFAVIGGLAVSVRTEPRFTRDIDLAVIAATDKDAEQLVFFIQQQGYRILAAFEHTQGRMSTVRLVPPGGSEDGVLVDLLFASSGIEAEIVAAAQPIEVLPGIILPVACVGHLIALKLLSVDEKRPKDAQDITLLLQEADPQELQRCREAIVLITQRGYHRGRDLIAALERIS